GGRRVAERRAWSLKYGSRRCSRTVDVGDAGDGLPLPPLSSPLLTAQGNPRCSLSSRAGLVRLQRQLADSLAGRREDRVGQRWGRDSRARLADPAGRLEVAHEVQLD